MKAVLEGITRKGSLMKKGVCMFLMSIHVISPFSSHAATKEIIYVGQEFEEPDIDEIHNIPTELVVETVEDFVEKSQIVDIIEETIPTEPIQMEQAPVLFLNLSPEEKEVLCRIVEAEVTGYSYKGAFGNEMLMSKFRVARVVINRVLDGRFPNTVSGVVYQRGQFGPVSDGRFWKVSITDMTRQAVELALDTSVPDDIPGALYFNCGSGHKSRKLRLLLTDAVGHKFYCYK